MPSRYRPLPIEHLFVHAGVMLARADLTNPERLEQRRRSVAMLTTGQMALKREEALLVLDALMSHLRTPSPGTAGQ